MSNPFVSKAVAEATSIGGWIKAQAGSLWSQHRVATLVIVVCSFAAGCVIH